MRTFHVKVVLGQRAEPEVKAYLGVHTLSSASNPGATTEAQ